MKRIALLIYGINDLKGGGGAERFFADFFEAYQKSPDAKNKLYYIIDRKSLKHLREVKKLKSKKNILKFKIISNRFKYFLEVFQLSRMILTYKIDIIHIPLYDASYLPLLKKINALTSMVRPKLVINIVNCFVPYILEDKNHKQHQSMMNNYFPLFKEVKVDGYFCWNRSFVDYVEKNNVFVTQPKLVSNIQSRFSDTKHFKPVYPKKNMVVYASRLDEQKHAEWYLDAIISLVKNNSNDIKGWKFMLFGNGPLRDGLMQKAKENNLNEYLEFKIEGNLSPYFNESKIFVSCQDYDNFPSLSMSEAMAAGNALVARNVGQTDLFLKNNINGLFPPSDNAEGMAKAILQMIKHPEETDKMGKESFKLIQDVHNVPNFIKQIDEFWSKL